tara:strand:- start:2046 stop:2453 length:408 start_codon:yes stop_codon:yes gene_type:complete
MKSEKDEAKKMGIRLTKMVKGKRVRLSEKELRRKILREKDAILMNQVQETRRILKLCKGLVRSSTTSKQAKTRGAKVVNITRPRIPPPPPPPPPPPAPPIPRNKPMKRDPRLNLMTALKANLKKRGIKEKLNQIS